MPTKTKEKARADIFTEYSDRFGLDLNQKPLVDKFYTQLEANEYLEKLPYIHDIEYFCVRLKQALDRQETICIYADFDTDAVTATGVMYWGLIDLGFNPDKLSFYTPDRFKEGYGVNTEAIDWLSKQVDLIITVDCGINSVLEADIVLRNAHADLIITDHHHLTEQLPNCLAVCNPRLSEYKENFVGEEKWRKQFTEKELTFIESLQSRRNLPESISNSKLSHSVTGVGTAWFSLVWLGYYLGK
jgi:DHH family